MQDVDFSATNTNLSTPFETPCLLILFKGMKNSGKSTLFNAIMSRNISKTSMCQKIFTESSHALYDFALNQTISAFDSFLYNDGDSENEVIIQEMCHFVPPVQSFFERVEGVSFRFVETVGFGNRRTDHDNSSWFRKNTKWADVLLFLIDKQNRMDSEAERSLFCVTVDDLMAAAKNLGKIIPLIIVINKVDDADDEDVKEMIMQCKVNVTQILHERGAAGHPFCFAVISALNALYYRMFMANDNFEGMEQKDIVKLAEMELGREGKNLAKDPSKRDELTALMRKRDFTGKKWLLECGMNELADGLCETLLSWDKLPYVLMQQLRMRLIILQENANLNNVVTITSHMQEIVQAFTTYSKLNPPEGSNLQALLEDFKPEIATYYQDMLRFFHATLPYHFSLYTTTALLKDLCLENIFQHYTIDFDEGRYDLSRTLFSKQEWFNILVQTITCTLKKLWLGEESESTLAFFRAGYSDTNHATSRFIDIADLTVDFLSSKKMKFLLSDLVMSILVPIVATIPEQIAKRLVRVGSAQKRPFISWLEDKFAAVVSKIKSNKVKERYAVELTKKKISMRDFFPGYSISLRVLHDDIPENDYYWADTVEVQSDKFEECVLKHADIRTERSLIEKCCAGLTSTVPVIDILDIDDMDRVDDMGESSSQNTPPSADRLKRARNR